jgi:hypothetical protein
VIGVAISDNTPPINRPATSFSLIAASVGDPDGTRMITSVVALLVVLGIGLVMLAVWLFRLTRPDDELLAPLEVMGERKWRRADPVWQRRRLDEVRPDDAQPLQPSAAPPDFDEAFDQGPAASGFDDLHDRHHQHEAEAEPEPVDASTEPTPPSSIAIDESAPEPAPEPEVQQVDADVDDEPDAVPEEPLPVRPSSATPIGIDRPESNDLPERELDPELMAAAMAELDAELGRRPDRDGAA